MEIGKKKKTGQPKSSAAKQQESLKEGTQEVGVSTGDKSAKTIQGHLKATNI